MTSKFKPEVHDLRWRSAIRPSVEPAKASGYGSRLVARSVTGQLSGAIDYAWEPAGLIVTLTLKVAKLAN